MNRMAEEVRGDLPRCAKLVVGERNLSTHQDYFPIAGILDHD
jgi:hypothetical protein